MTYGIMSKTLFVIPKKVNILINVTIPVEELYSSFQLEYFQREGFKDSEIENRIEEDIRDRIWTNDICIPDNRIKISFE